MEIFYFFFFFQAEDGIRDLIVTGVQTCALPICDASFLNTEREATAATAGLIGWLSEFGAVVIPTVGFFIRSQTFFHALVAAKDSSAMCGNSRALVGLGLSESDAERYENQLHDVGVLVYVSCPESARTSWAVELLRRTGAQEVASVKEIGATTMAAAAA